MNYQETLDYLYENVPMFQQVGQTAYKEGLETTCFLDDHFGNPHRYYKTIHVAGTNGKGSCSHTLAAIFQSAGYKTGLYTSPHMLDFRERMRVNGKMVDENYVIDFIANNKGLIEKIHPSFFELTTMMAFRYFQEENVDIAIIEVGMGGRLDCTNIIQPELSIITNISLDHTQFLGGTIEKIALEKAGIIKKSVPVIIGEANSETKPVFISKAKEAEAPIIFAEEENLLLEAQPVIEGGWMYQTKDYDNLYGELGGYYQLKNTNTILSALHHLALIGYSLSEEAIRKGFREVSELTGIIGRWQKLSDSPTVMCDTGHNESGVQFIVEQLQKQNYRNLYIIWGMVNDKDVQHIMELLPQNAVYYFTKASIKRALPEEELYQIGLKAGLNGQHYPTVKEAFRAAKEKATEEDLIFVGGSTFIVADFLLINSKG